MKDTILIPLSGGIDSTYLVHHFLKNTDNPIHVHHVSLRNHILCRWPAEDYAVKNIIKYFKENNYRSFEYSESGFDWYEKWVGWDIDLILFVCARMAINVDGENIKIAIGTNKDDTSSESFQWRTKQRDINEFWRMLTWDHQNKISRDNILMPLKELAKTEIINSLPVKLLEKTWYCRKPKIIDKNKLSVCGACHACTSVKKALASIYSQKRTQAMNDITNSIQWL